jgi:hypothetical protein
VSWRATAATLLLLGLSAAPAFAAPPTTALPFTHLAPDCVTGDNQFFSAGKYRWYVNQADNADGTATDNIKCDSYANDVYERPTQQTYVNQLIQKKPSGGNYSSPPAAVPAPVDPVFLSGMSPDSEFAELQTVFSVTAS